MNDNKIRVIKPFANNYRISSPFGERKDPITGLKKMHNGVDFACPENTPLRAILDGKIIRSGWEDPHDHKRGYGQRVYLEAHINGLIILVIYAHLNEIHKNEGECVCETGIIGLSGNTGKSTGPHLHIGARVKDSNRWIELDFLENKNV